MFPACLYIFSKRYRAISLLVIISFIYVKNFAQETNQFEETSIFLNIPKLGIFEVPSFVREEVLYLPVSDLFTFLRINNTSSPNYDSVSGFFLHKEDVYLIDRGLNRIIYREKVYNLNPGDLIRTETSLYLRSNYFGMVFGLQCDFNFRTLTVTLITNLELPVIRELRMEQMRNNLRRIKEGLKADTTINRSYPIFHFGMADWTIAASQQIMGRNDLWLNLSLGSIIFGGEGNVTLRYNNYRPFNEKEQYYLWHHANNDHPILRQVMLGKISPLTISSVHEPLIGAMVTNTPTTFRRSFGTYTLSDHTEPGWLVELYVNSILVDYTKADASGFFTFEVPLVYGNSAILLRFYSPWGEERKTEKNISIPFNFLPPRKIEYTASIAMIEDRLNSRFARANFNYGLNRRITLGGGVEYNSSVIPGSTMPFVNFSVNLASSLLISAEYTYGVRIKSFLSYHFPWDLQLELNYIRYDKEQMAINPFPYEERKAMISMPFRSSNFSSQLKLTVDQFIYPHSKNLNAQLLFSSNFYGISANITTEGFFYNSSYPFISSIFSFGFRLPARFILTPQVRLQYNPGRFLSFKAVLEKRLFTYGTFKTSYEYTFLGNFQNFQIGLQYNFSFAQTSLSTNFGNDHTLFVQTLNGSLMFDGKTHWAGTDNRTNVGRGALVISPFLDLNFNGKRELNEPKVTGLNVRIPGGGRIEENKRDSSIRVFNLEPFTSYFIETDPSSFENIAWQIKKPVISVAIDPNQFKLVEVPVVIVGEASGFVFLNEEAGLRGLGRVIVSFYRNDSIFFAKTLTEADGYFSFLGFTPGSYTVRIDSVQLQKIQMSCTPAKLPFTIIQTMDGDIAGGLEFVLSPLRSDTTTWKKVTEEMPVVSVNDKKVIPVEENIKIPVPEQPVIAPSEQKTVAIMEQKIIPLKDTKKETPEPSKFTPVSQAKTGELLASTDTSSFHIQAGAFKRKDYAISLQEKLSGMFGKPVLIIVEDGLYKVRIAGFTGYDNAKAFLVKFVRQRFPDSFVRKNR